MKLFSATAVTSLLLVSSGLAQQYDDYADFQEYAGEYGQEDNLYQDYATHQQTKQGGGGGGGGGVGRLIMTGAVSWILGAKVHTGRVTKKLKTKHQKEQKQLYSQYYNDVYKLSEQNQQLVNHSEGLKELLRDTEQKAEMEALQRDYEEFKQPDIDGDDRISRAEFSMYVKNYLSNYPGLSEKDYPKFDDFDHDGDGFVSFQEYAQQMALQAQQAELDQMYATTGAEKEKAKALTDLYKSASGGQRRL